MNDKIIQLIEYWETESELLSEGFDYKNNKNEEASAAFFEGQSLAYILCAINLKRILEMK